MENLVEAPLELQRLYPVACDTVSMFRHETGNLISRIDFSGLSDELSTRGYDITILPTPVNIIGLSKFLDYGRLPDLFAPLPKNPTPAQNEFLTTLMTYGGVPEEQQDSMRSELIQMIARRRLNWVIGRMKHGVDHWQEILADAQESDAYLLRTFAIQKGERTQILSSFLSFLQAEALGTPYTPQPAVIADLEKFFTDVVGIKDTGGLKPLKGVMVTTDSMLLWLIAENARKNAVEHGTHVTYEGTVRGRGEDRTLLLKISNAGHLPPAGTPLGTGLKLVKKAADLLSAEVHLLSKNGRANFGLILPLGAAPKDIDPLSTDPHFVVGVKILRHDVAHYVTTLTGYPSVWERALHESGDQELLDMVMDLRMQSQSLQTIFTLLDNNSKNPMLRTIFNTDPYANPDDPARQALFQQIVDKIGKEHISFEELEGKNRYGLLATILSHFSRELATRVTDFSHIYAMQDRIPEIHRENVIRLFRVMKGLTERLPFLSKEVIGESYIPDNRSTSLYTIMRTILLTNKQEIEKRGQSWEDIQRHLDTFRQAEILSDPGLVWTILDNLVKNAVQYGRNFFRFDTAMQQTKQGPFICFTIENDGKPIVPSELAHIWEPFRLTQLNNDGGQRFGLGLSLVKHAVDYLGGTISATSGPEKTVFTVTLPYKNVSIGS